MSQVKIERDRDPDVDARDEDERQYGPGSFGHDEIDSKFPNRPKNVHKTLLFSELFRTIFNPLVESKKPPVRPGIRTGKGTGKPSVQEQRRHIIDRFITRWRSQVGNDFYPALRLILPDKDRDRGLYGLKESNIGKLLVKLIKIDKNSEDGYSLLHWKLPGRTAASRLAGDFAGRCFEVLSKRPMRTAVGDMTIAEVNEMLDLLASSSGESENLRVLQVFYNRMNPEEMMWLIRIILKEMKVGATEKTFLHLWHPDAEALFNVSSSLRRVCWELYDPSTRLEKESTGVALMQCFQPQLAQFQMPSTFHKMVAYLGTEEEDPEFWIEEKLDGERMQMHMVEDPATPGGKKFQFWSRKGKDYTYLYGSGFEDHESALTRYLKDAFAPGVRNLILDGEMITWNMGTDKIEPFGTLKTAALDEKNRTTEDTESTRPLFRVFDIVLLNDTQLTQYTLRDRRRALAGAVRNVPRRLEILDYVATTSPDDVEPMLRDVILNSSEGLVLKNPRSMYRLNSRNDDWIKVKPEYTSEFGESLDLVVIGAYYGSGRRGGILSSYLCGLRVSENDIKVGANPEKCKSFCKVGGGFKASDYREIQHHTEGKWIKWDSAKPPTEYIELGGGVKLQYEKPDLWIRPKDSIVISVKAASLHKSDQFAADQTLRFPRFRGLRLDKSWDSALNEDEFRELKKHAELTANETTEMRLENIRKRPVKRVKRELVIAGVDNDIAPISATPAPETKLLEGMEFCVLSDAAKPIKKTKAQIEAIIKQNGGKVTQRADTASETPTFVLAEKKLVPVASLIKTDPEITILRPKWLVDSLAQPPSGFLLPYEPQHIFHSSASVAHEAQNSKDIYGDSFARDIEIDELRTLLSSMPQNNTSFNADDFIAQLEAHGHSLADLRSRLFSRCVVALRGPGKQTNLDVVRLANYVRFGGGVAMEDIGDSAVTHIVVLDGEGDGVRREARTIREEVAGRRRLPRIVGESWVVDCWKEGTLLDEERYSIL